MYLKCIKLSNFRCHKTADFNFSKGINIILGKNAVGKTSVVEAISYLSIGKSHKTSDDTSVIRINENYALVDGIVFDDENRYEVFVGISKAGKKIKRDGKDLKSISEHVGFLNEVVFSPEDVALLVKSPADRRRFLDISISQIDKNYLLSLSKYKRLLKERNELLKKENVENSVDKSLLHVLTEEVIKYGREVISKREKFLKELSPFVSEAGYAISNGEESLEIEYLPNCKSQNLDDRFQERLKYDIFQKTSTVGPHRDDFVVNGNGQNIALYGSQGQIRTAALSLKIGLSNYYVSKGRDVIVILDDVFSELDHERQNKLVEKLGKTSQVFITTTSISELENKVLMKSNIIKI